MKIYKPEKVTDDLSAEFRLAFGLQAKQYLQVYIWNSAAGLYANTGWKKKDYLGAYIGVPGRKKRSGIFGEIHLVRDEIGAGYVAHELQHFILDWTFEYIRIAGPKNQERICYLMGDLTAEFWRQFYSRYDVNSQA